MFGIFELIDKRWGINKVEQTLKGSNFDGKVKNKLDWLVRNTMKVVLKNQKITALEKQKDELEKQIKLEKEKAQKDKIRANYEKTLKEIVEKGDTQ